MSLAPSSRVVSGYQDLGVLLRPLPSRIERYWADPAAFARDCFTGLKLTAYQDEILAELAELPEKGRIAVVGPYSIGKEHARRSDPSVLGDTDLETGQGQARSGGRVVARWCALRCG
jgi:hypothetical protein